MAKYRITGPDGATYEITAPDDATEEQVLAYAQKNYGSAGSAKQQPRRISAEQARDPSLIPADRYRAAGVEPPKRGGGSSGNWYQDYLAGVGKSLADTGRGIVQYGVDIAADPANALGPLGRPILKAIAGNNAPGLTAAKQASARMRDETAERRKYEPSMTENPAFAFGNVVGTLGQLFTPGAALRGTTAGRAALPTTVGGNALQGGVLGTIQPVADQGERQFNQGVGTAAGFAGSAAPKVAGAVLRPVRSAASSLLGNPTASGVERRAAEQILSEAANPAALTRPQPSAVPGVQRTLAEETLDPGVARLERQMRGSGPANVFTPIDQANAAARVRSIESIAGTDADMAAAEAARDQAAGALRDQAFSEAERTAAQQIRAQALSLGVPVSQTNLQAQVAAVASQNATRPSVQSALNDVSRALEKSDGSAASLYGVRQYIGDLLSGKAGGDKGYAMAASRELIGVRDMVDQELSRLAPTFPAYLSAFRDGSIPINRMQIGRELLDRGAGSAIADPVTGVRPLTPAGFSRQANDLDSLAARATGFDKARADQILTPEDIAKIRAVQDDLERQSFRATAGSGGNSMTQERQALARRVGRSALQSVPIAGRLFEGLEAAGERRLNETLARLLANPEEARRVLSTLSPKDQSVLRKALFNLSARTGASVPALAE